MLPPDQLPLRSKILKIYMQLICNNNNNNEKHNLHVTNDKSVNIHSDALTIITYTQGIVNLNHDYTKVLPL